MSENNPRHGGARQGAGRPRQYVKVPMKSSDRSIEDEKWLFMVLLSDKEPIVTPAFSIAMPCQEQGCKNHTTTGIIQMVGHIWSIRPMCVQHCGLCSPEAWQCFKEMEGIGEATIDQENGVYVVKFNSVDGNETIPLSELEYSSELGLYDKRELR